MPTMRDFYNELYEKHGITTSAMFHVDLDKEITEAEYSSKLKIMSGAFDQLINDEDDEDDL
ncbi:hypothetical protein [Enterococcus alishanensis]